MPFDSPATLKTRYPILNEMMAFRPSTDRKYFDARCKGCKQIYNKMKLDRVVDHALNCKAIDEELREQLADSKKVYEARKDDKQARASAVDYNRTIEELLIDLIAVNSLPLQLIDSNELRSIIIMIGANITIPTRKTFTRHLRIKSNEVVSILVWSAGRSFLLDLVDMTTEAHDARTITALALAAIDRNKLSRVKFNSIITDGASAYKLARTNMSQKLRGAFGHRCLAHLINLIGSAVTNCPEYYDHFHKLHELIVCMSRNKALRQKLGEAGISTPRQTPDGIRGMMLCLRYSQWNKLSSTKRDRMISDLQNGRQSSTMKFFGDA